MNFIIMGLLYHYIRRPITLKVALVGALSIFMIAAAIGVARNNLKWTDDGFQTGWKSGLPIGQKISTITSSFRYGLIPLGYVYSYEPSNLQYGLSFVTPVTNIVPRGIWPSKPDTASMAMNKEYIEDRGPGPYQYPSGIIGFGIMNYGWILGPPVGFMVIVFFMVLAMKLYRDHIVQRDNTVSFPDTLKVILVIYYIQMVPGLVIGELANTIDEYLVAKVIPILILLLVIKKIISTNKSKQC
jgi:hypothetical protein